MPATAPRRAAQPVPALPAWRPSSTTATLARQTRARPRRGSRIRPPPQELRARTETHATAPRRATERALVRLARHRPWTTAILAPATRVLPRQVPCTHRSPLGRRAAWRVTTVTQRPPATAAPSVSRAPLCRRAHPVVSRRTLATRRVNATLRQRVAPAHPLRPTTATRARRILAIHRRAFCTPRRPQEPSAAAPATLVTAR